MIHVFTILATKSPKRRPRAIDTEATALWPQTMAALSAGDPVELQGNVRAADGYFATDQTLFSGAKIG